MPNNESVIFKQFEAVKTTRNDIVRIASEVILELERKPRSELIALEMFNNALSDFGYGHGWYGAGSNSGASDLYRGSIVTFDSPHSPDRINFPSARNLVPSKKNVWSGLAFFYASPMITFDFEGQKYLTAGDLAATVYVGNKAKIRDSFRRRTELQQKLLNFINEQVDLQASDIYQKYQELAKQQRLQNIAVSETTIEHGLGVTNIGHSLPIFEMRENDKITAATMQRYSDARSFIEPKTTKLGGSLWTVESRDIDSSTNISASFHDVFSANPIYNSNTPIVIEFAEQLGMSWLTA